MHVLGLFILQAKNFWHFQLDLSKIFKILAFLPAPGRSATAPYPFGVQVWAELRCKSSQGWANFFFIFAIPKNSFRCRLREMTVQYINPLLWEKISHMCVIEFRETRAQYISPLLWAKISHMIYRTGTRPASLESGPSYIIYYLTRAELYII